MNPKLQLTLSIIASIVVIIGFFISLNDRKVAKNEAAKKLADEKIKNQPNNY